jgi:hypothetical protein
MIQDQKRRVHLVSVEFLLDYLTDFNVWMIPALATLMAFCIAIISFRSFEFGNVPHLTLRLDRLDDEYLLAVSNISRCASKKGSLHIDIEDLDFLPSAVSDRILDICAVNFVMQPHSSMTLKICKVDEVISDQVSERDFVEKIGRIPVRIEADYTWGAFRQFENSNVDVSLFGVRNLAWLMT